MFEVEGCGINKGKDESGAIKNFPDLFVEEKIHKNNKSLSRNITEIRFIRRSIQNQ